jgi:hypothetical protein
MADDRSTTHDTFFGESLTHAGPPVLARVTSLYAVPWQAVLPLLGAGAALGAMGDWLLRTPGPPGLNVSVWVALVGATAIVLRRSAALPMDAGRVGWLWIGVLFASGLAWRDAPALKALAMGAATLAFAVASHRDAAAWVRRAGVVRYAIALALGVLHVWTAAVLALVDAAAAVSRAEPARAAGWRRVAPAIARGLVIAAPLVVVFAALFMSADAVFSRLVRDALRLDFEWIAGHVVLFAVLAWIAVGYLRSFLTGTDLPIGAGRDAESGPARRPLALGITEIATPLAAVALLFLIFVGVQFRYLFGSDTLVQITPDLTYAEYARRGFFELVAAVALVVPMLLLADWLVDRRARRNAVIFQSLAGVQIVLVLAVAASAMLRLRLYHASYGLTEARFYAMVLLIWMVLMLIWLAATVLRGRRDRFAFGALVSGLAAIAMLFVVNPDQLIARANVARMATADAAVRFDVAYATSLSADAVPELVAALPALPPDVQCRLARHVLAQWPAEGPRSVRAWNWSASRAHAAVRRHEVALRSMVRPDMSCPD